VIAVRFGESHVVVHKLGDHSKHPGDLAALVEKIGAPKRAARPGWGAMEKLVSTIESGRSRALHRHAFQNIIPRAVLQQQIDDDRIRLRFDDFGDRFLGAVRVADDERAGMAASISCSKRRRMLESSTR
jgi:hypothetical protein